MSFDGTIEATNAAWLAVLGYGPLDLERKRFSDLVHVEDRERTAADMMRHERAAFSARLRSKDGEYRVLRWWSTSRTASRRIYAMGRPEPLSLESSQRLLSLGQMALGVVHDLKNVLLHPMNLYLQRLERSLSPEAEKRVRDVLRSMHDVLADGTEAIDRMLQFTQPKRTESREKVDVEHVVWRATEIARAYARHASPDRNIALEYERGKPKRVECDGFELLAALINVMFNAIDAVSTSGGRIHVRTGRSQKRIWLEIVDDGPGMSDEIRTRIFEPFFTTKAGGIGIGLVMVKSCIDSHNGTITVDSKPGGGTTFRIELPG
jgi:signal transduction histidine kinase